MKILIMGLPGSGKTTLARALAPKLKAVHWNADAVRANINTHLGFSNADRIEQARRMGWLCDQVVAAGQIALADFVCPTFATRAAFGTTDCIIWMDTIESSRFEDTNQIFIPPEISGSNYRVDTQEAEFWSKVIFEDLDYRLRPSWSKALWLGFRGSQ
jgi:DNA polymerase III delta prime subunit